MHVQRIVLGATLLSLLLLAKSTPAQDHAAQAQEGATIDAVQKTAQQVLDAFNAGKVDDLTALFLPKGELIDEEGTIYQGQEEIKNLFTAFFEKYPGTKLGLDIESIRLVGPVAIDEGTRSMTTKEGDEQSKFRYIAVWVKTDQGWKIASFRDFADDPVPTPHEYLQPLAWLAGDWLNEGSDGKVAVKFHWSEDKNYLLGDFEFTSAEGLKSKSSQRIGWDPSLGKIRSWLFDADGGFADGLWTVVEDGIVIKSSAVNPDGETASATMTIVRADDDHFTLSGTDRIVAGAREPDFELTVVRRPPEAGK